MITFIDRMFFYFPWGSLWFPFSRISNNARHLLKLVYCLNHEYELKNIKKNTTVFDMLTKALIFEVLQKNVQST